MQPEDVTDVALGSAIRALYAASSGELDATDEEMRAAIAAAISAMPQSDAQAQIAALKSENAAITAARDLALASLCKQDAEIDALKAEQDALREALLKVARMAESLKRPCGMEPDSTQAIRNSEYMGISHVARAALAKDPK